MCKNRLYIYTMLNIKTNQIMRTTFKNKYGSVDINALINYKSMLVNKAKRLGLNFSDLISEFYSK